MKKLLTAALVLACAGCSWLPYEEDFACSRNTTYGKCVSVEGAYAEAVTGESHGDVITKDGVQPAKKDKKDKKARAQQEAEELGLVTQSEQVVYEDYRTKLYTQLRDLISEPQTPMVKPPKEDRTLILSYSPNGDHRRLYMPRYVYSIYEEAEFVMGQYRLQEDPTMTQLYEFLNRSQD